MSKLCHYAECGIVFMTMINVIMLSAVMLNVRAPAWDKHSSLFIWIVNDEERKSNDIDISSQSPALKESLLLSSNG
jgi:hypothetical protein